MRYLLLLIALFLSSCSDCDAVEKRARLFAKALFAKSEMQGGYPYVSCLCTTWGDEATCTGMSNGQTKTFVCTDRGCYLEPPKVDK